MLKFRKISPVAKAIATISAVAMLTTGVTFAALNDTATLTNNTATMASANADLLLWDGDSFESSAPGFQFSNLEPGVESPKFQFYFKNNGNVALDLTAKVPLAPTTSAGLSQDDVTLTFYGACGDSTAYTLAELEDSTPDPLPCNPLEKDAQGVIGQDDTNEANFQVTVKIAGDVPLNDPGENVGAFNIDFNGTANQTPQP